jgi:cytochrome c2
MSKSKPDPWHFARPEMFFKIDDAQARADIIAYLKELN